VAFLFRGLPLAGASASITSKLFEKTRIILLILEDSFEMN